MTLSGYFFLMEYATILPGVPELNEETDPVISHLIDIRSRSLVEGDTEAIIEELQWYKSLRDSAESIPDEDQITWKELHRRYQNLGDDQIEDLIHKLAETENGDFINQ